METDVLIVGAGPTGLMMAAQLARHGVKSIIVDRHAGPSLETRALGVQARTLEIYAHLGIADRAIEMGTRATGANLWAEGRRTARIPLGDMGRGLSPYPFLLILGQDDNERLLGDVLREKGVSVRWNTELIDLLQHEQGVTATLTQPDGTGAQVTARWVAGCDGARSTVRALNGIDFVGAPYEHVFFVADVSVTGPMVPDELNIYLWRNGFHLFFPMRGAHHWRVAGILPPELRGSQHLTFNDVLPWVRRGTHADITLHACSWYSTYRIHHRRAARFRDRRCFLLGDAAHVHSPIGAQGMNTGLQDAYNLAWKLALVVSGRAGARLLDTYEEERLPVAKRLLDTTDRAFRVAVSDSWIAAVVRTRVVARAAAIAMRFDSIRKRAFRTISQIAINYRDSTLSQSHAALPADGPRPGDRFPAIDLGARLDDTRFNLILVGQPAEPIDLPDHQDLVSVHTLTDVPGIPAPSFYLLRPDGHVGLAGTHVDQAAVSRYVTERMHVNATPRS